MDSRIFFAVLLCAACSAKAGAQDVVLEVDTRAKGAEIAPTMYGEDINYGADGGLYGELVKNRSFEFPHALMGWNSIGGIELKDDGPFDRCPHYLRLSYSGKRDMPTGIENTGFLGMSVRGGGSMSATVMAASGIGSTGDVNYGADKIQSPLGCDNSLDEPERIVPRTVESKVTGPRVEVEIPAFSVVVFRFKSIL